MKILQYITSLLPMIRKDDVTEDLRITKAELENNVMPAYKSAAEFFKSIPIKSKKNKDIANLFYRNYNLSKESSKSNIAEEISSKLAAVHACAVFLIEEIEATFSSSVINDGMDAKKALLIRGSDQLFFFNKFSLDLLSMILDNETSELNEGGREHKLLPIIEKNFDKFLVSYATILNIYGNEKDPFIKKFKTVPDVIVSLKSSEALAAVYHESNIDPVNSPIIAGFENNPIYHFRIVIAEWQANRYKANKDKKKMLELKLLQLKLLNEKQPDPKIEQEIEYIEARIQRIEYTMAKQDRD